MSEVIGSSLVLLRTITTLKLMDPSKIQELMVMMSLRNLAVDQGSVVFGLLGTLLASNPRSCKVGMFLFSVFAPQS